MRIQPLTLVLGVAILIAPAATAQNLVTNGSLTDPGAGGSYPYVGSPAVNSGDTWRVPPSWNQLTGTPLQMGQASADLWTSAGRWDGFNNYYGPVNVSPDGGVFVGGAAWANGNVGEGLWQNVAGLQIGQQYELTFYSSHIGATNDSNMPAIYTGPGFWNVYLDNSFLGSGSTVSASTLGNNSWVQTSMTFTATSGDLDLAFRAGTSNPANGAWLGIDGISLTASPVPEPSGALLLFLAGACSVVYRRRTDTVPAC